MKIWWLDYHPVYNTVSFVNYDEGKKVRELVQDANPLVGNWKTYNVILDNKEKPSDILNAVGGALIVSERAKEIISQTPNLNVEFLPLTNTEGESEFFVLNVLTVLNCVDPNHSKEKRLGSSNLLIDYEELELFKDVVQDNDIFRIMLHEGNKILTKIYVSDRLKEMIENHLKGYQLVEMWDSEFSWKQKEEKYVSMCEEINISLKVTFDFQKAIDYIQKNKGQIVFSGKWALKVDEENEILLGQLVLDGTYSWINPVYYPPVILGLTWGIKEKKKSLFSIFNL
ncbi:imm11 family protein [Paenibacillus sp. LjRoot56]|uniref:imm11 family protein n=1 Tax=Paenibacillus sp. LjRoot56 TaxID=3342333 RepID=UPI003ECC5BB4